VFLFKKQLMQICLRSAASGRNLLTFENLDDLDFEQRRRRRPQRLQQLLNQLEEQRRC
jgi:hypothetical protein